MSIDVLVNSIDKIRSFVTITNSTSYDIDLKVGKDTYLDAKSLMGILSCDMSKPMTVIVNCNDEEENERLKERFEPFMVS